MTEQEINLIRTIMREEVGNLRGVMREEINAAIYASEQRMIERMDTHFEQIDARFEQIDARFVSIDERFEQIDGRFVSIDARFEQIDARFEQIDGRFVSMDERFDRMDARLNRVEGMLQPMSEHLVLLGAGQRQLQSDMVKVQRDLEQTVAVLNEATIAINDLQAGQRALETKLDDHITIYRRDMQRLTNLIQGVDTRLTRHENTPIDRAHPRSHPPNPGSIV